MERCVCAPHNEPGGIVNEPKESDSDLDGSDVMLASDLSVDGRIDGRMPGWNVSAQKTDFMTVVVVVY